MTLPDLNLLSPRAADRLERESLDAYPAPGIDAGIAPLEDEPELISLPEPEPLPECGEAEGTRCTDKECQHGCPNPCPECPGRTS